MVEVQKGQSEGNAHDDEVDTKNDESTNDVVSIGRVLLDGNLDMLSQLSCSSRVDMFTFIFARVVARCVKRKSHHDYQETLRILAGVNDNT